MVAPLPSIVVILPANPLVVVETELDNDPIELLKSEVVVATEPDKLPMLDETEELKFKVVVATEPDKFPILELKSEVVVATDELNKPTLDEADDVYELNEEVNVYEGANDAVSADSIEPDMFIVPVTVRLPVTTTSPSDINPFFILNSFAMFSALVHFPQGGFLNKYFYINLTNDLTDH